jgi:hypothetical protein
LRYALRVPNFYAISSMPGILRLSGKLLTGGGKLGNT